MDEKESDGPDRRASLTPSSSTLVGVFAGGGAATTIIWIAKLFGLDIPPDVATWLGSVLGGLVGYPFQGGRKA